jgi:hypothetical protein
MSEKFEKSLESGMHNFLKSLEGNYKGITSVWFESDKDPEVNPCTGTLKSIMGGRFLLHEYKSSIQGREVEGIAIYGCSLGDDKLQTAWIDSFHNGTAIMFSENETSLSSYSVLGHYGKEPRWGWKTVITQPIAGKIVITMFNIPPGGTDEKAVETVYEKQ